MCKSGANSMGWFKQKDILAFPFLIHRNQEAFLLNALLSDWVCYCILTYAKWNILFVVPQGNTYNLFFYSPMCSQIIMGKNTCHIY